MWSEQLETPAHVVAGNPTFSNSSAAALLAYDVPHALPWDWRVSLYTWTKGIAAGAYLVAALLLIFGYLTGLANSARPIISANGALWLWVAPVVSGLFLAATGGLLIWDLEHPERFYLIFTRPQWRSWLVRGAFIIAGYSFVLALHFTAALLGQTTLQRWLIGAGLPLAVLTAVYTAYLFAQAKARDLWQNPLLPPHLLVQSLVVGAATLLPFAFWLEPDAVAPLLWTIAATTLAHLLLVCGELTLTHPTAHARLATWELTRGRFKPFFWTSVLLTLFGCAAPLVGLAVVPLVLVGLLLYEHAYVQVGQAVPLA
ncbi:MAG TPA: NrfD/PsrC family molybdoenzyme membrane anchor subunit, partial [Pyrinomonadaceae bacterium]